MPLLTMQRSLQPHGFPTFSRHYLRGHAFLSNFKQITGKEPMITAQMFSFRPGVRCWDRQENERGQSHVNRNQAVDNLASPPQKPQISAVRMTRRVFMTCLNRSQVPDLADTQRIAITGLFCGCFDGVHEGHSCLLVA